MSTVASERPTFLMEARSERICGSSPTISRRWEDGYESGETRGERSVRGASKTSSETGASAVCIRLRATLSERAKKAART